MPQRAELVFALVGAVGTDLRHVGDLITQSLSRVGYTSERIRLSDLVVDRTGYAEVAKLKSDWKEDERIGGLMDAGDAFRRRARRGDAVALLGIAKMRALRQAAIVQSDRPRHDHAFILHSLKHPVEVETLRAVYGDALVVVAVYMPRAERERVLTDRIARSHKLFDASRFNNVAAELIARDEREKGDDLGQNVRDTFPEADVFLDGSVSGSLREQVDRVIEILFHHPHRTPTLDEYLLFHARATALRSADLARQVGAVIATADGEIIAAGCNEVPTAGGGAVWEEISETEGKPDRRDFTIGYDPTARMKLEMMTEVFERLQSGGWISQRFSAMVPEEMAREVLVAGKPGSMSGARVASIIEFGRIVHAEMSAITDAARRGLSVKNAKLFCTTFPCHMCARHIIASGISEVVYVEPYPKSKARELYEGMLRVDHEPSADLGAVHFRPFVGVAPRRYLAFFEMPKRKDSHGHVISWDPATAYARVRQFSAYLEVETAYVNELAMNSREWGLEEGDEQ